MARGVAASLVVLTGGIGGGARAEDGAGSRPTALAGQIVGGFDAVFAGPRPGTRAVHAKGVLAEGTFEPSTDAAGLSVAEHFRARSTPVVVRFSNFAGVPGIEDGAGAASPRGMAIKFLLPDGADTDLVTHSYDGFPAATPEEFLAFLRSVGAGDPARMEAHLAAHPAARRFADAPKPTPASYARERFFGVNAFLFTDAAGRVRAGRYRVEPVAGAHHLGAAEAADQPADFLRTELAARLRDGPARFRLLVQLADPEDSLVDGSVPWPEGRRLVEVGTIALTTIAEGEGSRDRTLLFTPLNLVAGIAPSQDPLLVARNRAYRISFDRRSRSSVADAESGDLRLRGVLP